MWVCFLQAMFNEDCMHLFTHFYTLHYVCAPLYITIGANLFFRVCSQRKKQCCDRRVASTVFSARPGTSCYSCQHFIRGQHVIRGQTFYSWSNRLFMVIMLSSSCHNNRVDQNRIYAP